jgi:hypothetical protein
MSARSSFSLEKYIMEEEADIEFERELYNEMNFDINTIDSGKRRFSLSVPESVFTIPESPKLTSQPLKINIPSDNFSLADECVSNIEMKGILPITSPYENIIYKRPSKDAIDARNIWLQARIPNEATIHLIEKLLIKWAIDNANNNTVLKIKDNRIEAIAWKSVGNAICHSSWKAFLRWIVCSGMGGANL